MRKINVDNAVVEVCKGDIANQSDCDCVVNAANAQLRIGGGVAGAIHRAAGENLTKETRSLAPIKPGEAVITGGHNLPNKYIIHCLGPVYGRDEPSDELLKACYNNALSLAAEHHIGSIAFPAISTGAFGYPMREAARISLRVVKQKLKDSPSIRLVRFVLWSEKALKIHEEAADEIYGQVDL